MAFGVTTTGFVAKTIADVRSALNAGYRSVFGLAVNVDLRSRNGQMIGLFAEQLVEAWQLAEAIVNALNPRTATGLLLDFLCALTGTIRRAAFPSAVRLTLTGTPTTLVLTGKRAQVNGTSTKFQLIADATIAAASDWLATTGYAEHAYARNGGNIYQVTTPGLSAGSGGPSGTGSSIPDGSVVWTFVGVGTGYVEVDAEATENGRLQGYSRSITIIDTPVAGWSGVSNRLDADPGALLETDGELRRRREQELGAQGSSPLPGIRAAVLGVTDVTTCTVYENNTDNTVGGIPPHSFECIIEGGDDTEIAQALFDSAAGGIPPFGSTVEVITDTEGNDHNIGFSRPELVDAYVEVTATIGGEYPADGEDQVKQAIVAAGDALLLGRDIVPNLIGSHVIFHTTAQGVDVGIPGVLNVTVRVKTSGSYQTDPIEMSVRQRAVYDTSRITVITVAGLP